MVIIKTSVLKVLILRNCGLRDHNVKLISQGIILNNSIIKLDLEKNHF